MYNEGMKQALVIAALLLAPALASAQYYGYNTTVTTPYWCGSFWSSRPCAYNYAAPYNPYGTGNYYYTYTPTYTYQYPCTSSAFDCVVQNYQPYTNWSPYANGYYNAQPYYTYNGSCAPGYYLWGKNCWISSTSGSTYNYNSYGSPLMYPAY